MPDNHKLIERLIVGLVACAIAVDVMATELPRVMPYLVVLAVIFRNRPPRAFPHPQVVNMNVNKTLDPPTNATRQWTVTLVREGSFRVVDVTESIGSK